jgi:peptidyl-prolyl cis-trans isomerase SurA
LDDIRKQNHLDSMEALEKAVREQGISYEDWRSNIRNSIITQEVVRNEVGRTIRLTPREEQAYYEAHKQEFQQPEQVRLSEILIPTPDDATDAQVAQAKAKADDIEAKLKAGEAFDALAKQYSGGPNADVGGDLGDFKKGALPKLLEDQTFPLKVGEYTEPIRTRQGYVVLKVTQHTQTGVLPLNAVEDQVQQAIYEQAIQPALRAYLTKLRENAYIDIASGFVDTGASPKQTKPVFAGATPPPVKKKHAEKARLERGRAATEASAKTDASTKTDASAAKAGTNSTTVQSAAFASNGKHKKVKREKIRFGQAPENSLPPGPEETAATGADQGAGASSAALAPSSGEVIAPMDQPTNQAANADPFAPETVQKKTRYTARQATEKKIKASEKANKAQQKAAATPTPLTTEEKTTDQVQSAPLGLNGDTASKKKKQKAKDAPKERIQRKAPEPPAEKPEPTPIPPKTVRDNGEPAVTPVAPAPATTPAPANTSDTQPGTQDNTAPAPAPTQPTSPQ